MCGPAILAAFPALAGGAAAGGAAAGAAAGSTLLGTLGTVATVGGGLVSAYAQMQNAKAASSAANATAAAQEEASRQAIEQGEQESDRKRRAGAALASENTAAMAANGVDVTGSHALDILDDSRFLVEEDAFTIRENARRSAGNMAQQAANSRTEASSQKSAAFFQPVSTLLGTAAKVGNKYSSWVVDRRQPATAGGAY